MLPTSTSSTPPDLADAGHGPRRSRYPLAWDVPFAAAAPVAEPAPAGVVSTMLAEGTTYPPAALPLPCDILWERDVPVRLRDGVVIRVDVLRPLEGAPRAPALLAWSPYGKQIPARGVPPGVAPEQVSGLAKFEGPDPGFWVAHGYAVVNVDPRGVGHSEGDLHFWGSVDGQDGRDVVEWAAAQPWCNGKVGLHGTSWLAMAQWHIAAARPPHMAAIAPWNGITDPHRQDVCWGGIPNTHFMTGIASHLPGAARIERPDLMMARSPLHNPYWEDKAAPLEAVQVPAYVVTDFVTDLHRLGTVEGFRRLGSPAKWLRVHSRQEWADQYDPASQHDLLRFFDHYLKEVDNGWPQTPRVRMTVLDPGGTNREAVPCSAWPLVETEYRRLYLEADGGQLSAAPPEQPGALTFDAATGNACFTLRFDAPARITGYLMASLWLQAPDGDDLDVFLLVEKLDAQGRVLAPSPVSAHQYFPVPPPGAQGRLRLSARSLDPVRSTAFHPVPSLRRVDKLQPGEVVRADIAILPTSLQFRPGEQLRLTVAGHEFAPAPRPPEVAAPPPGLFPPPAPPLPTVNVGRLTLHTGPLCPSWLQLPWIPEPSPA